MSKKLKAGLIGYGISAKIFHAPFLKVSPHYEVAAVLERKKKDSLELFPDTKIVRTLEELLAIEELEVIIITTPNETHFPYAMQILQAGKHVVVEKPFTIKSEEALQLVEAAKKAGKILSVYQNRRYDSEVVTIKEILNKGLLGKVYEFEAHYDRYRLEAKANAWREEPIAGSGIFYDLGAHLIDQALYFFGLPQNVTADIRMIRPHARVDDYFDVRFDYGYMRVLLKGSMLVREKGPHYMIHGDKGSFIKYGEDPQEVLLKAGELPQGKNWGKEPEETYGLLHTEIDGKIIKEKYPSLAGNYGNYHENLYQTIRNGAPLREKPEHGYNTVRLIELAFESHHKKATVSCEGLLNVGYPAD
ncbi:Gfo/Idh/MocA family oxidoreductase [Foetidibacter luteolus]|uniref:Gfo/Idh/MocA family oxidoreductase n=1 Tax=Foetidibacter luteolus TaxID=2608880 RepID=UPI00129B42A3|nr:Gfo/Idh/MocA family oxidoreductase [Foetidibacter luteolus]